MPTHIHFVDHIHRKVRKIAILGQSGPFFPPVGPPGEGVKVEKRPKVSRKVIFVWLSLSFGFKKQLNAPFSWKTGKKLYFPIFSIVSHRKYRVKHVCCYPDLITSFSYPEIWHETFLSCPKQTLKISRGGYFFCIKYIFQSSYG